MSPCDGRSSNDLATQDRSAFTTKTHIMFVDVERQAVWHGADRRQGPAELWPPRRGVHGDLADRRPAGDARQWLDGRLHVRQPGRGRRLAQGRCRGRRHLDRGSARLSREASASSISPICAIPTATSSARCIGCRSSDVEIVSRESARTAGGKLVCATRRRRRHRHDLLRLPAAAGRKRRAVPGAVVSVGPDLHPCQRHREGRVSRRLRRAWHHLRRARTPARAGRSVPDDPEGLWDFGQGAGFYVDATEEPWAHAFPHVVLSRPRSCRRWSRRVSRSTWARQGITGHSMGGHGALTVALGHARPVPERLRLLADRRAERRCRGAARRSAIILARTGSAWRRHDAVALIEDGARVDGTAGRHRRGRPVPGKGA